jgi:hypothetical protein
MLTIPVTVQSNAGEITLDATAIYTAAKTAFLADYADDPAVRSKIVRNGDLAEREYTEMLKGISPERCALATPEAIKECLVDVARMALCHLAIGYKRRAR